MPSHSANVNAINKFKCYLCPDEFHDALDATNHLKSAHDQKEGNVLQCMIFQNSKTFCSTNFNSLKALRKHMKENNCRLFSNDRTQNMIQIEHDENTTERWNRLIGDFRDLNVEEILSTKENVKFSLVERIVCKITAKMASKKGHERKCEICRRDTFDERTLGRLQDNRTVSAHVNPVLFSPVTPDSTSLAPDPKDDAIAGVTTRFVRKEGKRAKSLTCNYCKASGANIGCCFDIGSDSLKKYCRKKYHVDSGYKAGASFNVCKSSGTVSICFEHRDPLERTDERPPMQLLDEEVVELHLHRKGFYLRIEFGKRHHDVNCKVDVTSIDTFRKYLVANHLKHILSKGADEKEKLSKMEIVELMKEAHNFLIAQVGGKPKLEERKSLAATTHQLFPQLSFESVLKKLTQRVQNCQRKPTQYKVKDQASHFMERQIDYDLLVKSHNIIPGQAEVQYEEKEFVDVEYLTAASEVEESEIEYDVP